MKYLLTAACGLGKSKLTSFDNALLNTGVANYNLVKVSSILPANAVEASSVDLPEGSILHTAFSSISSNKCGEKIASAIGVGLPHDVSKIGVIMEYSCLGSCAEAEKAVKEMIVESMNNRGYDIKEIKTKSTEILSNGDGFVTAYSCLAIWS